MLRDFPRSTSRLPRCPHERGFVHLTFQHENELRHYSIINCVKNAHCIVWVRLTKQAHYSACLTRFCWNNILFLVRVSVRFSVSSVQPKVETVQLSSLLLPGRTAGFPPRDSEGPPVNFLSKAAYESTCNMLLLLVRTLTGGMLKFPLKFNCSELQILRTRTARDTKTSVWLVRRTTVNGALDKPVSKCLLRRTT